MPQGDKHLSAAEISVLTSTADAVNKTMVAPIERVKLLIQNQNEMLKTGRLDRPYKGIIDCIRRIGAEEGIYSFWRGNLANCIRCFPNEALNFAFKDKIKTLFSSKKTDSYEVKFARNVMSGGAAGALALTFLYSLDYARTRLANDVKSAKTEGKGEREFKGLIDVYRKTLKTDGIQGLYRGFVVSCVGVIVYRALYFGLYDTIRPLIGPNSNYTLFIGLGYAVTLTAGFVSYPIDTVRRRMMMTSGQPVKYKGSIDCAAQIIQNEGVTSLFKGAGVNILRGLAGASALAIFSLPQSIYDMYSQKANKKHD